MTIQFKSEFARQASEMLAFAAVKAILNGRPDAGRALLTECGDYRYHVKQLLKAGLTGNSQRLLQTFQQLCRIDPNFQALIDAYMEGMDLFVPYFDAQNLLKPAPADVPTAAPALVPGFLPVGLSILAGRPKLGKSWLALQFATAIATGRPLLGFPTPTLGCVYYFALEDTRSRITERFIRQGMTDAVNLTFATTCPPLDGPGIQLLATQIKVGYNCFIIDTFTRAVGPHTVSNPTRILATLERLHALAHQRNVAILLIDHHRKAGSLAGNPAGNPVDDILGGTAKAGVIDAAYGLYRAHGDDTALLRVSGRDLPELDLRLQWDPTTCTWSNCGDNTTLAHTERQQEILTALATLGPTALTPLAAYIGQDRSNLLRRLKTLLQTGAILRTCNDHHVVVYSLPATPTPPTNPTNATNASPLPPSSPTTPLPTALPTPTTTQP